jgi:hypothetical protein
MNHSSWLIYLCCSLLLTLFACGDEASTDRQSLPSQSSPQKSAEDSPQAKALTQLEAYYDAIEKEAIDVDAYFAPTVNRFFAGRNLTRSEIERSLQRGFEQLENRQIEIDPSSVDLSETPDGYQVTFRGVARSTNASTGERNQGEFHNQVVFNQDWLITTFTTVETQSRGLAARSAGSNEDALMAVAVRTLQAFKSGKLAEAQSLIHPSLGYYFVFSPGAMDMPQHYQTLAQMTEDAPWMGEGNQALDAQPTMAELPTFSCDDEFSKEGCFLQRREGPYQDISELQIQLMRVELIGPDQIDESQVQQIQAKVSAEMVDTDAYLGFYFGQVEGKWYLLVIDAATYDCSA